jgi:predicted DNA-binding ribbon-helix-helix protein
MTTNYPSRNVYLDGGRRTSARLEPEMWDALVDIAKREGVSRDEVVRRIDRCRGSTPLSSALRVFCATYYRAQLEAWEDVDESRRSARLRDAR